MKAILSEKNLSSQEYIFTIYCIKTWPGKLRTSSWRIQNDCSFWSTLNKKFTHSYPLEVPLVWILRLNNQGSGSSKSLLWYNVLRSHVMSTADRIYACEDIYLLGEVDPGSSCSALTWHRNILFSPSNKSFSLPYSEHLTVNSFVCEKKWMMLQLRREDWKTEYYFVYHHYVPYQVKPTLRASYVVGQLKELSCIITIPL